MVLMQRKRKTNPFPAVSCISWFNYCEQNDKRSSLMMCSKKYKSYRLMMALYVSLIIYPLYNKNLWLQCCLDLGKKLCWETYGIPYFNDGRDRSVHWFFQGFFCKTIARNCSWSVSSLTCLISIIKLHETQVVARHIMQLT